MSKKIFLIRAVPFHESLTYAGSPFLDILAEEDYPLYDLARFVIESYGLDFSKAFGYYSDPDEWKKSEKIYELYADLDDENEDSAAAVSVKPQSVKNTTVAQAFVSVGGKFLLVYDYGEEYKFYLEVESLQDSGQGITYPALTSPFPEGEGRMPDNQDDNHYYDLEQQAKKRLAAVFDVDADGDLPPVNMRTLEVYYDYVKSKIQYPFRGVFTMQNGEATVYIDVEAISIMDTDETPELDKYGLICEVKYEGQIGKMPIAEIVINQEDPNYDYIEDYCIWFWENHA
jgi:hypothetical protein